jgi:hypothetical protein
MLDLEKTRQREALLAHLRELYAEIAENEKFLREFEIQLLLHNIKLNLQELLDRERRRRQKR